MPGKSARDKGTRREREIRKRMEKAGIPAVKVPLSGGAGGEFGGDLWADIAGRRRRVEVKARAGAEGWKTLKTWLTGSDLLVLVEDRAEPLVLMPFTLLEELIRGGRIPTAEHPVAYSPGSSR